MEFSGWGWSRAEALTVCRLRKTVRWYSWGHFKVDVFMMRSGREDICESWIYRRFYVLKREHEVRWLPNLD